MSDTKVVACPHPSSYLSDELDARQWSRDDLAKAMGGDFGLNRVALDFFFIVGPREPALRIGDMADQFALALGTSAQLWRNLETAWLAYMHQSSAPE